MLSEGSQITTSCGPFTDGGIWDSSQPGGPISQRGFIEISGVIFSSLINNKRAKGGSLIVSLLYALHYVLRFLVHTLTLGHLSQSNVRPRRLDQRRFIGPVGQTIRTHG